MATAAPRHARARTVRQAGSRDLLITAQTPALGTGQALRVYTLARALAGCGDGLSLLFVRFGAAEPDEAFRAIPGIDLRGVRSSRGARRALLYARRRFARVPSAWARGISPELVAVAREMGQAADVRRVIADGPVVAAALAPLARQLPVVYNAHNLESAFRHDLTARGLGSRRAFRAAERRLLSLASEAWMVSEADVAGARSLSPAARIRYVPNVVDAAAIAPVRTPSREPRVLMVADFTYQPNRRGLRYLLEHVLPLVWSRRPEARLALVGRGLSTSPSADARVEGRGFVNDLRGEYARSAGAVVPLLEGGGTPFKLIEALAYGIPVVATTRAAAAIGARPGVHCLAGENAPEFAAAILRVLDGPDAAMAKMVRDARRLVEDRYSIEALIALVTP